MQLYTPTCSFMAYWTPPSPQQDPALGERFCHRRNSVWVGFMGHRTATMAECRVGLEPAARCYPDALWCVCFLAEHPLLLPLDEPFIESWNDPPDTVKKMSSHGCGPWISCYNTANSCITSSRLSTLMPFAIYFIFNERWNDTTLV